MALLPPGNFGLPFVGETLQLLFDPDFATRRFQKYGPIFKTRILGRPSVFMAGPEAAEFILSSHIDCFTWRDGWPQSFKILLGQSLFVQEGEEHRRNRKLMMPAFHGAALARYLGTIATLTQTYLQQWEARQELIWYDEFKQLTFDIASCIFLGSRPGEDTTRLSQLFTTLTNGLFGIGLRKAIAARNEILDYLTQVIQTRQQNPTDDALSLLIQAGDDHGDSLSLEEIRAQAMLLLFAGHETTTAMLTWICLELARHPDILQRARTEQSQLLALSSPASLSSPPLTLEQLGTMPYLEQILNEVERLHPPVAGGFRGVVKPFEFKGYQVPAGWLAQYSILQTQRSPEVYTNPEQFDPDRFSPERQEAKQKAFSLIGFGGGPRICLGIAFAKLEMKIVMAYLLRGYEWELLPNQNLEPKIIPTRRPKDGLKVKFRRKEEKSSWF
ncbi:cytochrome P450 [Leptothermofonsia sichuanensis E412]|uniref:cytochrome P450 n=1 Tax=Leptothermofonsia sichuanensis TaxID=2917832 RepID=UPI001CA5FB09|nr:cytochrome P450 [Leptothermofonsia sichuanensis]QZZ21230.1 cytochrome P450 [Leptothermofonsia sichuanensis E412]